MTINIRGGRAGVGSSLSNFAHHPFIFDDVPCNSIEGFLQALKYESPKDQPPICLLIGWDAKNAGEKMNPLWKNTQTLWWKGVDYKRDSKEYQELLNFAYASLCSQNEEFREALLSTGSENLVHTVGCPDPKDTVLTEEEFCSRLLRMRAILQKY